MTHYTQLDVMNGAQNGYVLPFPNHYIKHSSILHSIYRYPFTQPHVPENVAVVGEALVIRDVPVEHVELVHLHEVDEVQDGLDPDEVPGGVQHEPAVLETGVVDDSGGIQTVLKCSRSVIRHITELKIERDRQR